MVYGWVDLVHGCKPKMDGRCNTAASKVALKANVEEKSLPMVELCAVYLVTHFTSKKKWSIYLGHDECPGEFGQGPGRKKRLKDHR